MTIDRAVQVVQVCFPQVYLACHTRHQRKRSTEHRLSQRDAAILAHLDERRAMRPSELARHLGVARSTLSEALKRLVRLGFVSATSGMSQRTMAVILTPQGVRAIRDTSVLETDRLRAALRTKSARDRAIIVAGMSRLAAACRSMDTPSRDRQ